MPDFERIFDDMSIALSSSSEEKAYFIGYKKGKTRARLEVLILSTAIYFVVAAIGYLVA